MTLVEYGDFECPYCGQAEPVIRELLASFGDDVRYVWRHLPLNDVHRSAQLAAEASEAAARPGQVLGDVRRAARPPGRAEPAGPRALRGAARPRRRALLGRAAPPRARAAGGEDVASADASGVSGTPTFFINGRRHHGAYDVDTLTAAVEAARRRARLLAGAHGGGARLAHSPG